MNLHYIRLLIVVKKYSKQICMDIQADKKMCKISHFLVAILDF